MEPIERGLTVGEFCLRILQKQIDNLGADAFAHTGTVVLYSGPDRKILEQAKGLAINPVRSEKYAKQFNASRIDDTAIAKFLESIDLAAYFNAVYDDENDILNAERDVWAYASRQFIRAGFRTAVTAVCGADPTRVFRAHELKVIITEDTAIETINGVAIQHFKDTYKKHVDPADGFYAAYVEICRAELDAAHQRTLTATPDELGYALEDYNARKLFFDLEQEATARATAHAATASTLAAMTAHKAAITGTDEPDRPADPTVTAAVPKAMP